MHNSSVKLWLCDNTVDMAVYTTHYSGRLHKYEHTKVFHAGDDVQRCRQLDICPEESRTHPQNLYVGDLERHH